MHQQIIKVLRYIPNKQKYDLVRAMVVNHSLWYCVDDIVPGKHFKGSFYAWDYKVGKYNQYICEDNIRDIYRSIE